VNATRPGQREPERAAERQDQASPHEHGDVRSQASVRKTPNSRAPAGHEHRVRDQGQHDRDAAQSERAGRRIAQVMTAFSGTDLRACRSACALLNVASIAADAHPAQRRRP
jgi:hypothetical protein